ncbi:hypothetical protein Y1Q_0007579 [Alligator mississippiensis]|uniref:Uncharacterized protein n=1 Tax=Alligator mississippiensis TaxID=8496 RepID=A0A151NGI2_ALLMI|nr:hypothetical protein Y1Q_0007579 [Alligator mississippiensis]
MGRGKMENEDEMCDDGEQQSEESSDMEIMEDMALMTTIRRRYRYLLPVSWNNQESKEVEFDWTLLRNLRRTRIRTVWAHESSSDWWEQIVLMTWNDQQWLEMFRMKKEMFYHIISILGPHITRQDTSMHQAMPPEKTVAMAIMTLASPSSLHYMANQFSVAACTVRLGTHEVYQPLEITTNKIMYLAKPQEVIDGFNGKGFPNCVGALESTHIPVVMGRAFTNRKGYASVILQTVVDH